ncbi:MAG: MMPL family transporter [Paludibacteraceae bacterium]|nr:MMPL family transporter [Paludibacteraceae bacterium]
MKKLFVGIYDYLATRRALRLGLLAVSVVLLAWMASHISFRQDITDFIPGASDGDGRLIFEHLQMKDRSVVLLRLRDSAESDPDLLLEVADAFRECLTAESERLPLQLSVREDPEAFGRSLQWIYAHLPLFLDDAAYQRLDSMLVDEHGRQCLADDYAMLLSPVGAGMGDMILNDPFMLAGGALDNLQKLGGNAGMSVYDGALFSNDFSTLVCFLDAPVKERDAAFNEAFTEIAEQTVARLEAEYPECRIQLYGAPVIACYNARQVQRDLAVTMSVALLLVVLLVWGSLRSVRNIVLLIVPVLYGMLFALAFVWLFQSSISAIAVGTGSVVMGIALSYSVHLLAHSKHCASRRQLVEELAYPLTVGSFTTIGAFVGLQFTHSPLLQDFGLFAACTLVGTTLFCLIFLPHLLRVEPESQSALLRLIDRANAYRYDRNPWLVLSMLALTVVGFCYCQQVRFDYDMMHLNFETPRLKQARQEMNQAVGVSEQGWLVATDAASYRATADSAQRSLAAGELTGYASVASFLPDTATQARAYERWQQYWTDARQARLRRLLTETAAQVGFKPSAFDGFLSRVGAGFRPAELEKDSAFLATLMGLFVEPHEDVTLFLTRVDLPEGADQHNFSRLDGHSYVAERSYYIAQVAQQVNDDFDRVLWISSLLIFAVLCLSYRRIELALLAFMPMCLSWVVITALMALLDIRFNIVNIVLSSFIFGVGDDFSIFVLDGLRGEYTDGRKTLSVHKTAIFFSALITMIGMGALLFARHPAIHSLALVSLLGIGVVVLMAYVLLPWMFEHFIAAPVRKGGFPHTLGSLLRTSIAFAVVLLSLLILHLLMPLLLPLKKARRQYAFRWVLQYFARLSYRSAFGVRMHIDRSGETFDRPAVLIANHQSLLDLLMVMGLSPKIIIVTQDWVWHKSPFCLLVRYAGYVAADAGLENVEARIDEAVGQGCSIMIFPEGTRSTDFAVHRFRKGAFYVADKWRLDMIPSVMYGTGMAYSKLQADYISAAWVEWKFLPRIPADDHRFGETYQEKSKQMRQFIQAQYTQMDQNCHVAENPYWKNCERRGWLYKESRL